MSELKQKIHFIAIGGITMHNLAVALSQNGIQVTGSDEHLSEPGIKKLKAAGILPPATGWFPEKITPETDVVILGRKAERDNPELLKALQLGIKVYSYPEYIYEQCLDKQRIVISGSYGKSSICAMVLHVLKSLKRKFDYVVGAPVEGFENLVKLSDAPIIIIEGDENISSAIDPTPKFLHYHHHIGVVSGVAWDYVNAYPTFDEYVKQFDAFADSTPKGGILIYCESEDVASLICCKEREDVQRVEYDTHKHEINNGQTFIILDNEKMPLQIFGKHNMKNLSAARAVCAKLGISDDMFYESIRGFKGIPDRLEVLQKNANTSVYKEFSLSPSKLKATTSALKKQFPERILVAVLELCNFNNTNKEFLSQYKDTFTSADQPVIYYNPSTLHKNKLQGLSEKELKDAFDNSELNIITDTQVLKKFLSTMEWKNKNLLLMTSWSFDGLNLTEVAKEAVSK